MRRIRKTAIILAVMLVIGAIGVTAFAAGGLLKIDDQYTDETMGNLNYSNGYAPIQTGDTVSVVLPLTLAGADTVTSDIVITPNLGDTATSPFVFKNYQQTGHLDASNRYVGRFTLTLKSNRYAGSYPIVFTVSYTATDETEPGATAAPVESSAASSVIMEQSFTVYASVDGADPNATPTPEPSATVEPTPPPRPQPKLIVSKYGTNPDVVQAGETFAVNVTLDNTSEKYDVKNLTVTYAGDGKSLLSADNANTQYIEKIKRGESADITFNMLSRLDSEPGIQTVTLTVGYEDSKATAFTLTESLLLQVTQPVSLEYDEPDIPQTANAGDTLPLNLNLFNTGRSKLYNVMVKIEAAGLLPEGSAFVGNMDAGTSGTAEMYVFVGTLAMSQGEEGNVQTDNGAEKYGYTNGAITITYEDEFGNPYSQEIPFDMQIEPPVISASAPEEEEEPVDTASQWWISVLIGAALIAAVVAVMVVRRKRKLKALGDGDGLD